jgi:hypothetical protein
MGRIRKPLLAHFLLGGSSILLYYFSTCHTDDPLFIRAVEQANGVGAPQFAESCDRFDYWFFD